MAVALATARRRENGEAKARAYGRFLGERYRSFSNIVWFNGNDSSRGAIERTTRSSSPLRRASGPSTPGDAPRLGD